MHTDAPGTRRRVRRRQLAIVLTATIIPLLFLVAIDVAGGRESSVVLGTFMVIGLAVGGFAAWAYGAAQLGNTLHMGADGVWLQSGHDEAHAPWEAVVLIDRERGAHGTGPTLLLDREVDRTPTTGLAYSLLQAVVVGGSSSRGPIGRVSLVPFVDGPLADSPIADDLRRHVPELLADYLARHEGSVSQGTTR